MRSRATARDGRHGVPLLDTSPPTTPPAARPGRALPGVPSVLHTKHHARDHHRPGDQRRLRLRLDADQAPRRGASGFHRGGGLRRRRERQRFRLSDQPSSSKAGRRGDAGGFQAAAGLDPGGGGSAAHPDAAGARTTKRTMRSAPSPSRRRAGDRGDDRHGREGLLPSRPAGGSAPVQPQKDLRHRA